MPISNESPLVSVIVPCYNDGEYLQSAIDSVKKQTYGNIELILVDDGSDDPDTIQAVNTIDYPSLVILHTNRLRPAGARNEGIRLAKGKYILPLDADDMIEPEYISRAVAAMEADPLLGIVYCHADLFGEQSGPWTLPDYNLRLFLLDNCIFVTALFRREDWVRIGGFCTDYKAGMEDYDFWLSILESGKTVCQLPETFFHYRIKPSSRTSEFNSNYNAVQSTYVQLYHRHKSLYEKYMDLYCLEMRRSLIDHIWQVRNMRAAMGVGENDYPLFREWVDLGRRRPGFVRFVFKILHFRIKVKSIFSRLLGKNEK